MGCRRGEGYGFWYGVGGAEPVALDVEAGKAPLQPFGGHQAACRVSARTAGTKVIRMMNASSRTPAASAKAICFSIVLSEVRKGYPTPAELAGHGWTPVPRTRLPFPSTVAGAADSCDWARSVTSTRPRDTENGIRAKS